MLEAGFGAWQLLEGFYYSQGPGDYWGAFEREIAIGSWVQKLRDAGVEEELVENWQAERERREAAMKDFLHRR